VIFLGETCLLSLIYIYVTVFSVCAARCIIIMCFFLLFPNSWTHVFNGVLISPQSDQEVNKLGIISGEARDFNNIETRAVIKLFFLQFKVP